MINIKLHEIKIYTTNCLILQDELSGEAAVVDPGRLTEALKNELLAMNGGVKYILLTHGHYDHIGGAGQVKELFENAKIVIGEHEEEFLRNHDLSLMRGAAGRYSQPEKADILLRDGQEISLGETKIRFIHTPGHTKGGGCYVFDDKILAGDTLFRESIGRVDLPTGSAEQMLKSLKKLKNLQGDYVVYPGHGPLTTLNHERENNPYILTDTIF